MNIDAFKDNKNLVHEAAKRGYLETLEVLGEHGALLDELDGKGNTPLHYAAYYKNLDSVVYLVHMGCTINAVNDDGMTALMYAVSVGHLEIVKYLHEQGAVLRIGGIKHPALIASLEVRFET